MTFLADDLLEGREAGTRGHEIAARYIASQFDQLGIQPGGRDGTFFEPVRLLEYTLSAPTPPLVLKTRGHTEALRHGDTAILFGSAAGGRSVFEAPLVFVGYGITDSAVGQDDYAGLDVRGKIAVALFDSPKGMDSEIGAHLASQQMRVAAAHGAIALIRITTRRTTKAFPWEQVLQEFTHPLATWMRADGTPFDPSYGLRAVAIIKPTAAPMLFQGSAENLDRVLDAQRRATASKAFRWMLRRRSPSPRRRGPSRALKSSVPSKALIRN